MTALFIASLIGFVDGWVLQSGGIRAGSWRFFLLMCLLAAAYVTGAYAVFDALG